MGIQYTSTLPSNCVVCLCLKMSITEIMVNIFLMPVLKWSEFPSSNVESSHFLLIHSCGTLYTALTVDTAGISSREIIRIEYRTYKH